MSSRLFTPVIKLQIVHQPISFQGTYKLFTLTTDTRWFLIVAFYPKKKVLDIKHKLTQYYTFECFYFLKVKFMAECPEFPCCTIFHKAKFPSGCVNHVFYMLSYHITFWIWLNLVWYVTILQYVCPREL